MSAKNLSRFQPMFNIFIALALLLPHLTPLQSEISANVETEGAVPDQEETPAAQLAAAGNTMTVNEEGISPEILEVMAGTAVTFANDDSRSRTLTLSFQAVGGSGGDKRIFLPIIQKEGADAAARLNSSAQDSPAVARDVEQAVMEEQITLSPGQRIERTFHGPGELSVRDAENAEVRGTVLITPQPISKQGTAMGQVLDYETKAPLAGARVKALDGSVEAVADGSGSYSLGLPPGDHTIVIFANGYTFANRSISIQPYTPTAVDTVELVPLDETVTAIGSAGGTATNSDDTTGVEFAQGAVESTEAVRLTVLAVDEMEADFEALPGPFTDGSIPVGFVMFEPDGTEFAADAVWTIEYDGPLPVGTYVPCYYWLEEEARWGEPVDGEVVDLGGGQKGLRATLPHFSAYGFAGPPTDLPPLMPDSHLQDEAANNRNERDYDTECGSQLNLMSGELCHRVGTLPLPSAGGASTHVWAKYYSSHVAQSSTLSTTLGLQPNANPPDRVSWSVGVGGQIFEGGGPEGYDVSVAWDGRGPGGEPVAPGVHNAVLAGRFHYNTGAGWSIFEEEVTLPMPVVRPDLSPFGIGWFGPHDTLLVDNGDWATVFQGNGRYLVFTRNPDGSYEAQPGEFSTLSSNAGGSWILSYLDGTTMTFNGDGRLTRIEDRYGNFQQLLYEPNGQTVEPGKWGLTTRIRRIVDTSGNSFAYSYDDNGWLARIGDSTGRTYSFEHDGAGHLTAFTDPLGNRETFTYDDDGRMTSHSDPLGRTTTYVLDEQGRVVSRSWPTGTSLAVAYAEGQVDVTFDNSTQLTTWLDEENNPVRRYNGVYTATVTYNEERLPERDSKAGALNFYDEKGNLIQTVGATHATFAYEGPFNRLSQASFSGGERFAFEHDGQGNVTAMTNALSETTSFTYDAHGQPLSVTDPLGHTSQMTYDSRGLLTTLTDPLDNQWTMAYDSAGNPTSNSDSLGRQTAMTYDLLNRVTQITDPLDGATTFAYDDANNLTRLTDPSGRAINYEYDELNRTSEITYPDGGVEQFSYDGVGNLSQYTNPRGQTIDYRYDDANRLSERIAEGGPTVGYVHDDHDRLASVDDGLLRTHIFYETEAGAKPRLDQVESDTLPLNSQVFYDYGSEPPTGSRYFTAAPSGTSTEVTDDIYADTTWTLEESPYIINVNITVHDDATLAIEPGVTVELGQYDSLWIHGNLVAEGTPNGRISFVRRDPSRAWGGLKLGGGPIGGENVSMRYVKISGGHAAGLGCGASSANMIEVNGASVTLDHVEISNGGSAGICVAKATQFVIQHATVENNGSRGLLFDLTRMAGAKEIIVDDVTVVQNGGAGIELELSHLEKVEGEGFITVRNSWIASNGIGDVNPWGIALSRVPDNIHVAILNNTITNHEIGIRVSRTYPSLINIHHNSLLGNSRGGLYLDSAAGTDARYNYWGDLSGPYEETYNPDGKGDAIFGSGFVPFEPWLASNLLPGDGRLAGILVSSNDNDEQQTEFSYDDAGRLVELRTGGIQHYTLAYDYDAAGRLLARRSLDYAPLDTSYSYDAADRLTTLTATGPTGSTAHSEQYVYDAVGNVTQVVSSRDGTISYEYDTLNRLTAVKSGSFNETYTYDAAGNRLSAGGVTYTYDSGGRLTSRSDGASYEYDAAGNLVNKKDGSGTTAYTWDGQGRLERIDFPDGSYAEYGYDEFGRRISKRLSDGTTRYYVYVRDLLVQELDENGLLAAAYTYDGLDRPISMWRGNQDYYYILDRLGSVVGLVDGQGNLLNSYRYDPWGNLLESTEAVENPLRFTGREYDEESGLYFHRARYYDPEVGRFISRDPIGIAGGLNLYAYVANNPVVFVDPSGLIPLEYDPWLAPGGPAREFPTEIVYPCIEGAMTGGAGGCVTGSFFGGAGCLAGAAAGAASGCVVNVTKEVLRTCKAQFADDEIVWEFEEPLIFDEGDSPFAGHAEDITWEFEEPITFDESDFPFD